jgi:ABC-type bacteriocin/lantibiotic exporter with double-glycine peptidase domain
VNPGAVQPIVQPGPLDCGLAALAMYLGRPLSEVVEQATRVVRSPRRGLTAAQLRRVARRYGVHLLSQRVRVSDLDDLDDGAALLLVRKSTGWHWVLWFRGVVVDPADGVIHAPEAYWSTHSPWLALLEPPEGG